MGIWKWNSLGLNYFASRICTANQKDFEELDYDRKSTILRFSMTEVWFKYKMQLGGTDNNINKVFTDSGNKWN